MNNKYRTNAQNEFEKNFFKLMNNSVFGKTMENVHNHRDTKLVNTYEKLNKYVNEPNMVNIKYFSKDLLAIEMRKTVIKMYKPLYLGLTILDLSKITMYEFYYDYLKPKYDDDVKSCYTDTDSFIIHIKTDDIYADINNDVNERFDTSNISKNTNRTITSSINKKVLNMMKDELGDDEMIESVNVCAKLYSFTRQTRDGKVIESSKAKGVKKCIKKNIFVIKILKMQL